MVILLISCKNETQDDQDSQVPPIDAPEGMVWVPKKQFVQGAKKGDQMALKREKPAHKVEVDGFFIDKTEVTNKEFRTFVEATDYVTLAERPIDWEELKQQVPEGTPKPHDSILAPGSLIFNKKAGKVENMNNYLQWWTWQLGADWKHPEGPESSIEGKDDYPVVHIAYEDALAYCKWANRRLPTEAEWEAAALGKEENTIFTWGNKMEVLNENANTWQGEFPALNEGLDGFESAAPVKSYPPNSLGVYDMMGNVWEITSDLFNINYYQQLDPSKVYNNPKGAKESYSPNNPYEVEHVMKGGSFLCHASYCASFRISARMGNAEKSSSDHVGFRTVATPEMLKTAE
jgi:formylglycine-generating enzyme required for sulfatase activity